MASLKDYLRQEGYKKLEEAKKYIEEFSLDDPDDEPYRSLYKGREIYKDVRKMTKKFSDKRNSDEDLPFLVAALELKIGENYVSTDEKSSGEEHLQKCLEKMEDYKLTLNGMGIYQDALNQMGILMTGRHRPEEALEYFKQSEQLYVDFKNLIGGAPCTVNEFLSVPIENKDQLEHERAKQLESTYTHTLFYFAQVYQQLGKADISAQYVHHTLQRQLDAQDLDPLDWSLHAATLSQFYITERNFNMSRHCLASAEVVFQQAEANNINCPDEMKEKVNQARADIQRCWVKYGLGLLEYSKNKLLHGDANETSEESVDEGSNKSAYGSAQSDRSSIEKPTSASSGSQSQETITDQSKSEEEASADTEQTEQTGDVNDLQEKEVEQTENDDQDSENTLDKEDQVAKEEAEEAERKKIEAEKQRAIERAKQINERFNLEVTSHEEKITDKCLMNFEEARVIFLLIKKWIEEAKQFYKFDYHCNDYVAVVQDQSLSFKFLSFFELDLERQCKMHKRRIDMLSEVLKELSLQHYLLVCRQLMFEIADTYSTMMDLKLAIMESSGESVKPTPHHVRKMNSLINDSIKYYQEYLNTLKGGKPVYPDQFPENDVRAGLVAMFCIGRLFSKFLAGDVQTRLLNIKKSKDCYQFVVDYCKRNPSAVSLIPNELEICKEMAQLLPAKMERIRMQSEM